MALWCRNLQPMTVAETDTAKPLTLVLPFYMNHWFLAKQVEIWRAYPAELRALLSVIVVDDGSPTPAVLPPDPPCAMRLFRIEVDIRWNWLAARNIGAHHAEDGWILLTDMDHVVPEETLRRIMFGHHRPGVIYVFDRVERTGEVLAPHSASFLMTKARFWEIGGYDERMSGFYGSDGHYRRRIDPSTMRILSDKLVRHEHMGDSSTTAYKRKQPEDAKLSALVASFPKGSTPKTLSFAYHEVTA